MRSIPSWNKRQRPGVGELSYVGSGSPIACATQLPVLARKGSASSYYPIAKILQASSLPSGKETVESFQQNRPTGDFLWPSICRGYYSVRSIIRRVTWVAQANRFTNDSNVGQDPIADKEFRTRKKLGPIRRAILYTPPSSAEPP